LASRPVVEFGELVAVDVELKLKVASGELYLDHARHRSGRRLLWRSGRRSGELVHVGLLGLLRAPAGRTERVCELLGELADLDR
jgi:hypothetical protein